VNDIIPIFQSDDAEDQGAPVCAETTVLWLYSKLVQAGVEFDSVERECIDAYFRSVEPVDQA